MRKEILITSGKDIGKYATITKVLQDGNLSVRFENGRKTIIRDKEYLELKQ